MFNVLSPPLVVSLKMKADGKKTVARCCEGQDHVSVESAGTEVVLRTDRHG